jgi:hypothetical protein
MSKLTFGQEQLLKLIARTQKVDGDWRRVSETCCVLFEAPVMVMIPEELYIFERLETGGRVRLTDRGQAVVDYL